MAYARGLLRCDRKVRGMPALQDGRPQKASKRVEEASKMTQDRSKTPKMASRWPRRPPRRPNRAPRGPPREAQEAKIAPFPLGSVRFQHNIRIFAFIRVQEAQEWLRRGPGGAQDGSQDAPKTGLGGHESPAKRSGSQDSGSVTSGDYRFPFPPRSVTSLGITDFPPLGGVEDTPGKRGGKEGKAAAQ